MTIAHRRATDPGVSAWEFRDPVWVHCPACNGPARSTSDDGRHRLLCTSCGHQRAIDSKPLWQWMDGTTDGRFDLPLYLTATIGGHTLWAFNLAHIDALTAWLGASLRERPAAGGLVNKTMMSRLPRWLKAASTRPKALKALARLRAQAVREGLS